jgi:type IV pilus assembly protein PilE
MIAVAVVGILATIAVPSYTSHLVKVRRSDAQGVILETANFMERFYTENLSYLCTRAYAPTCGSIGATPALPDSLTRAPREGTQAYNIGLQTVAASTYTLRATPISGSPQASDGLLEYDHTGARRWDKNADGDFSDTGETAWSR